MHRAKRYWLAVLTGAFLLFGVNSAAQAWDDEDTAFHLTLDGNNNTFYFLDFLSPDIIEIIDSVPIQRQTMEGLWQLDLRLRLGGLWSGQWGVFARQATWGTATGEAALFVQNAQEEGRVPAGKELYDLGGRQEKYTATGLYWSRQWAEGAWTNRLQVEALACLKYRSSYGSGQGALYPSDDGDQGIDIFGTYRDIGLRDKAPPGLGGGLSWESRIRLESGVEFSVTATNLLSAVYFPETLVKNGQADAVDISGDHLPGPVLTGFTSKEPSVLAMPLAIRASYTWPMFVGRAGVEVFRLGEAQDYRLTYALPLGPVDLIFGCDPVMFNLEIGCAWQGGRVTFFLGEQVYGLTISI